MSFNQPAIKINIEEFDASRVVIEPARTQVYTNPTNNVQTRKCLSKILYTDTDMKNKPFYIQAPRQSTSGFYKSFAYNKPEVEENLEGVQFCYDLTSYQTQSNPTNEEAALKNVFDSVYNAVCEKAKTEMNSKEMNDNAQAMIMLSIAKTQDTKSAVKPIYTYPKLKDAQGKYIKGTQDKNRSPQVYVKFDTNKKYGKELELKTKVVGPGNVNLNAFDFIKQRGVVSPVFEFKDVYWGNHPNSSYGASIKIKIPKVVYTPVAVTNNEDTYDVQNNDPMDILDNFKTSSGNAAVDALDAIVAKNEELSNPDENPFETNDRMSDTTQQPAVVVNQIVPPVQQQPAVVVQPAAFTTPVASTAAPRGKGKGKKADTAASNDVVMN